MLRFLPLSLAFVVVLGVAVYDGVLNNRWVSNKQAEVYAEMLDQAPKEIGPWKGKDAEVDDDILRAAGAEGYVSRAYVNEDTEEVVRVWLIVGPFKHIVRHTPDICYPSEDFQAESANDYYSFEVDGIQNKFLTNNFTKGGPVAQVFWSWLEPNETGDLEWYAAGPHKVRELYAGTPALFKLYFTTVSPTPDPDPAASPSNDFAKLFLPILDDMIKSQRTPDAGA